MRGSQGLNSETRLSARDFLQKPKRFRRLWADRVIGVDIRGPDQVVRINDVARGHRQAVFRFVMKPVEGAPERLVEVPQVLWKSEDESKLLSGLVMKIGENIEGQIQLLAQGARVPLQFRS